MSNPIVQLLQARIGQSMDESPSPLARWLKGVLKQVNEGELMADFLIREEMTNPIGILHGGAMAAIIDDMIGTTVFTLGHENFYTSINLTIDFLSSATAGEVITATSKIIRKGSNIVNAECVVTNMKGKILARGTSNLIYTQIKRQK